MSSYEVVERGAAAGIVITASHNPWTDNGFKVKSPTGSAAGPEILAKLEARIAVNGGSAIERRPLADAEAAGLVERFDPFEGYEAFVRRTVDLDALRAADVRVLVEPMWGAGAGWLSRLLSGGTIRVTEIHQERNPYFGGVNPEPIRPNIDEALGTGATGRVVPPGEGVTLGDDDLLVERRDGRLEVVDGPRDSISSSLPTALISGGGADRPILDALLERVAAQEATA